MRDTRRVSEIVVRRKAEFDPWSSIRGLLTNSFTHSRVDGKLKVAARDNLVDLSFFSLHPLALIRKCRTSPNNPMAKSSLEDCGGEVILSLTTYPFIPIFQGWTKSRDLWKKLLAKAVMGDVLLRR